MGFTPDWDDDRWPRCPRCGYGVGPSTRGAVDVVAAAWQPLQAGRWHGRCHEQALAEYRERNTGKGGRYDLPEEGA